MPTTRVSGRLMADGSRLWSAAAPWPAAAARALRSTAETAVRRGEAIGLRGWSPARLLQVITVSVEPRANLEKVTPTEGQVAWDQSCPFQIQVPYSVR